MNFRKIYDFISKFGKPQKIQPKDKDKYPELFKNDFRDISFNDVDILPGYKLVKNFCGTEIMMMLSYGAETFKDGDYLEIYEDEAFAKKLKLDDIVRSERSNNLVRLAVPEVAYDEGSLSEVISTYYYHFEKDDMSFFYDDKFIYIVLNNVNKYIEGHT